MLMPLCCKPLRKGLFSLASGDPGTATIGNSTSACDDFRHTCTSKILHNFKPVFELCLERLFCLQSNVLHYFHSFQTTLCFLESSLASSSTITFWFNIVTSGRVMLCQGYAVTLCQGYAVLRLKIALCQLCIPLAAWQS